MDISTIMVHVDARDDAISRLSHAVALAAAFRATLIGLLSQHPNHSPRLTMRATDCDSSRQTFEAATEGAAIAVDWRVGEGTAIEAMHCEGRLADLIVVSQPAPPASHAHADSRRFVEATIIGTGPPVLVIPVGLCAPDATWPYSRVMVAWSGTRESARALRGALPICQRAQYVEVVSCIAPGPGWQHHVSPPSYGVTWLARRGVKAVLSDLAHAPGIGCGQALIDLAARRNVDLLVCGVRASRARDERHCSAAGRNGDPDCDDIANDGGLDADSKDICDKPALTGIGDTVLRKSPIPALFVS